MTGMIVPPLVALFAVFCVLDFLWHVKQGLDREEARVAHAFH